MSANKNTHPVSEDMDENESYFYDHTNHLPEDQQCFDMEDRVAFLYILARRSENDGVTNKEILSLSMNAKVKAYMLRDHMVDHSALAYLKKKYVQKILSICPEYSIEHAASATKKDKKAGLFGSLSRLFVGEDRSNWAVEQYAQAIANKVTNPTPCEDSGLEAQRGYVRTLGQEVNDKWGFEAMQQVWQAIHDAMGPGPCSDLTRIWDGVGRWQK